MSGRIQKFKLKAILLISLFSALAIPMPVLAQTGIHITDLGKPNADDTLSQAIDINERGQVVGYSLTASGERRAFLWTAREGMKELGSLGGDSLAYGINSRGEVVGESCTAGHYNPADGTCTDSGQSHAFLWTARDGMIDLGTLGGDWSWAIGINNRGQVVGASWLASGEFRAFLWTARDGMVDLGTLGGDTGGAIRINQRGQVAGVSDLPSGETHATVWEIR